MAKRQSGERNDRYFQLHHYTTKTEAWAALSAAAVRVYVQIGIRYNGANNGKIAFSVRDATSECNIAAGTAMRALKELVDLGFIEETRHGGLSKKTRIASEWRLTAFKCDLTGALKTCAFMHRGDIARTHRANFSRASLYQTRSASVSKEHTACIKRGAVIGASVSNDYTDDPQKGPPPVSNDCTHIVYQSTATGRAPPEGLLANVAKLPWSPPRSIRGRIRPRPVSGGSSVPIDALAVIEGLFLSNALSDGSASSATVH
jgi:DNA-binding transcriptional regulator YhcF (GntR family)